jgi:hypothetical protein
VCLGLWLGYALDSWPVPEIFLICQSVYSSSSGVGVKRNWSQRDIWRTFLMPNDVATKAGISAEITVKKFKNP